MTSSQTSFSGQQRFAAGFLTVLFAAALTACGGGGGGGGSATYSGKNTPATIDGNNADDLAEAATQGSIAAIVQDDPVEPVTPIAATLFSGQLTISDELRQRLDAIHQQAIDQASTLPETASAADINIPGDCGGSIGFSFSGDSTVLKYKNWCVPNGDDGSTIINGTVTVTQLEPGTITRYENFTVTDTSTGEVERIDNMTITCQGLDEEFTCSIVSDFVGTNGITYRVENVNVTDNDGDFDVEARVYDRRHGYVNFVAEGLVRNCEDGSFSDGTITVSSPESAMQVSVVFSGCGMVTVSVFGVF